MYIPIRIGGEEPGRWSRARFGGPGNPAAPRLVTSKGGIDHTERMLGWSRRKLKELETLGLCGYICKKDSPSSGMERVKVYGDTGAPAKGGAGGFTRAVMEHFPPVPAPSHGAPARPPHGEEMRRRIAPHDGALQEGADGG